MKSIFYLILNALPVTARDVMSLANPDNLDKEYNIGPSLFATSNKNKQLPLNDSKHYYVWYEQLITDLTTGQFLSYCFAIKQKVLPVSIESITYDREITLSELLKLYPILLYEDSNNLYCIYELVKGDIYILSIKKKIETKYRIVKKIKEPYQETTYQLLSMKRTSAKDIQFVISYLKRGKIGSNIPKSLLEALNTISLVIPLNNNHTMYIITLYTPHKYDKCNEIVALYENNLVNLFVIVIDENKNITYLKNSSSCCLSSE